MRLEAMTMSESEKTLRRPLLCCVGLHRYEPWAFNSMLNPIPVERCVRPGCGVGRQWNIMGYILTYTAEQMREMARGLEEREEEREPDLRIVS